jgi:hypothetical protein
VNISNVCRCGEKEAPPTHKDKLMLTRGSFYQIPWPNNQFQFSYLALFEDSVLGREAAFAEIIDGTSGIFLLSSVRDHHAKCRGSIDLAA